MAPERAAASTARAAAPMRAGARARRGTRPRAPRARPTPPGSPPRPPGRRTRGARRRGSGATRAGHTRACRPGRPPSAALGPDEALLAGRAGDRPRPQAIEKRLHDDSSRRQMPAPASCMKARWSSGSRRLRADAEPSGTGAARRRCARRPGLAPQRSRPRPEPCSVRRCAMTGLTPRRQTSGRYLSWSSHGRDHAIAAACAAVHLARERADGVQERQQLGDVIAVPGGLRDGRRNPRAVGPCQARPA